MKKDLRIKILKEKQNLKEFRKTYELNQMPYDNFDKIIETKNKKIIFLSNCIDKLGGIK